MTDSAGTMIRLADPAPEYVWLGDAPDQVTTGFDHDGWESTIWVLHAMYEHPDFDSTTHDDATRSVTGENSGPMAAGATRTGITLGRTQDPGPPWRRVTWADHRARTGAPDPGVPPCHRWFAHSSWPVSIQPPGEGSLDDESLELLITVLVEASGHLGGAACFASYAALPARGGEPHLWRGPMRDVPLLSQVRPAALVTGYDASPSNIWPVDRSWFVLTDWDLMGTKISGSQELINRLAAEPGLETIGWP